MSTPGTSPPGQGALAPQLAVGAVCVRNGRLLLVRRGRGVSVGAWSLPGGRVEAGETLTQAVERELWEETALEGRAGELCGIAERIGSDHHYVIVDFWVEVDTAEVTAGDDASEVRWVDRASLRALDLVPRLEEFLDAHGVLDRMA